MSPRRADALLLAACFLWGVSFVIVKGALDYSSPLAFVALRFALAAVIFAPFAGLGAPFSRQELAGGGLLALLLAAGFIAQAAGLVYTTPSRSAFLVAISSVLAPPIAILVLRERPRRAALVALLVAALGTWLLTAPQGGGGLNKGDALTLITAAAFGGQIVAITALARRHSAARLVWLEIVGTALLAGIAAPLVEGVHVRWTAGFVGALGFTAVGATVLALLWQLNAQREMTSTRAAVLFCSEALFAALTSWIVTGERLAAAQWLGGGLILAGMIVAEWPVARSQPGH